MDPAIHRENYIELKRILMEDDHEYFSWQLEDGWSSLPPWADYELLTEAIKGDKYEITEELLKKGCRIFRPGHIDTPLHMIVQKEWWDLIKPCLELGARVSDPNQQGDNVVHLINDSSIPLELYHVLLKQHLQETTVNVKNHHGVSFLHIACTLDNVDFVRKCLEYNPEDVDCQVSMYEPFRPGSTPLHWAVESGNIGIIKLLIDHNASLDIQDANGSTPIHCALDIAMRVRNTEILDLLFTYYFIHAKEEILDDKGRSLFMAACCVSDNLTARFTPNLLTELANEYDNDDNTPLHFAARFGRYNIIDLLLQSGAECCWENNEGLTPLEIARQRGFENVCNLLQERCVCDQPTP